MTDQTTAVYTLAGEVDAASAPEHLTRLVDLIERAGPQCAEVVVDMSGARLVDTTGLGMLITAQRSAHQVGTTLVLRGANHRIVRLMQIAGTHDIFTWRD